MKNFLPTLLNNRDEFLTPFDSVFDTLIKDVFPNNWPFGTDFFSKGSYPKCDVQDYSTKLEILAEIPGMDKNDVNIKVKDGILHITGKKRENREEKDEGKYKIRELKKSSFARSFMLNDNLDKKNISAEFKNGELTISIPKITPEEPEIYDVKID